MDRLRLEETAELLARVANDAESPIPADIRFARDLHTLGAEHLRLATSSRLPLATTGWRPSAPTGERG